MRVLEAGSANLYKMGKSRKHRVRKSKDNEADESSDDGAASCTHITKAANFAAMKKALSKPTVTFGECTSCSIQVSRSGASDLFGSPLEGAAAAAGEDSDVEPTVWVCLQCGHQGCDRNSSEKHALKHYETPHSSTHCIVANLTTWSSWCYICDNDIPWAASKRIQECVDYLRKQAGLPRMEMAQFAAQRPVQTTSQSDVSPIDNSPPASQSRTDKTHISSRSPALVCQKVKGLSNLGNTCFFNAVMQNLCQTHSLESLLVSSCKKGRTMTLTMSGHDQVSDSESNTDGDDEDDLKDKLKDSGPVEITCGEPGPLTQALLSFVQEMSNGSTHGTVNPNTLFSHVCKKAPRFKGFQQQDSHELLRYLLDVVRNEEIKRAQGGILKYFKLSESTNPKKVDEETKLKVKEYGRHVKYTFLDSLFGGQLVSTVMCEECKHISQIFEPFLDLSLPVTEEKPQRPNQMLGGKRKDSTVAGEVHEEAAPLIVVDGFAKQADKPSKHQERKNRRQARKEARKKHREMAQKGGHRQQARATGEAGGEGEEEKDSDGADGVGEGQDNHLMEEPCLKGEGDLRRGGSGHSLDADNDNNSPQDDPSDADIEDNLETDTSRLNISTKSYDDNSTTRTTTAHASVYTSNLNYSSDCNLDAETSVPDLAIKSLTQKENHILPLDLTESEESQPPLLESFYAGIKDRDSKLSVEELSYSFMNLEIEGQDVQRANVDPRLKQVDVVQANHMENCDTVIPGVVSVAETGVDKDTKLSVGTEVGGDAVSSRPSADQKTSCLGHPGKTHKDFKRDACYRAQLTLVPRYQPTPKECSVMSCLHQFTAAELLTGSNKVGCKVCTKKMRSKNSTPCKDKKGSDMVCSNASKQFLILVPPAILTLHLKRFEQVGFTSRKVNRHVEFPTILDIAPYCSSLCPDVKSGQKQVLYSLYGIVEHSGKLSSGHYTAYVKVRPSLGPVTNFLHGHRPIPCEFIHKYMEQVQRTSVTTEDELSDDTSPDALMPPGRWFHISDSRINEVTEATVLKAQAYLLFYERVC